MRENTFTIRASSKAIKKYIMLCWCILFAFFLGWLYLSYNWVYDSENLNLRGKLGVILMPFLFIAIIHEIKKCSILRRESSPLLEINRGGVRIIEREMFFKWDELKTIKLSKSGIRFFPIHRLDGAREIHKYLADRKDIFQAARYIKKHAPAEKTKHLKDKLINRY